MSYILEALKKAQAERELGTAPTIHTAPPPAAPTGAAGPRKPLLIGLGAGALAATAAGFVFMRSGAPPTPAARPAELAVLMPRQAAPMPEPAPAPPQQPRPKPAAPKPAAPKPATPKPATPKPPAPEPAPVVLDDSVPALSELPQVIRHEVPQVALGGYIYSPNPAERLLLVDKVLRREGEEVAPGLTLEKLLPKAAVMNYRGYRYRLPY